MKANLKNGIWLVAAFLISLSTMAQGHRHRDRDDWDDDDWYEDRYRSNERNHGGYSYHKVVRQRPPVPYYIVPRRPSPRHIWIPAEYRWRHGRYDYVRGYWMVPPRRNMHYIPGYWQPTRGGYVWVSGFWQRGNVNIGMRF
jgi:hypothetical protein